MSSEIFALKDYEREIRWLGYLGNVGYRFLQFPAHDMVGLTTPDADRSLFAGEGILILFGERREGDHTISFHEEKHIKISGSRSSGRHR